MSSFSTTFNTYMFTSFVKWLLAMVFGLSFIILLVDLVELLKRHPKVEPSILEAATMSALRVPSLLMEVLPILVLFAVIGTLWWRSRSHELIVARATGLSLWQFLKPVLLTTLLFGAFVAAAFDPLMLRASQKLKVLEAKHFYVSDSAPVLRISSTGTWLREAFSESSYRLVRARGLARDDVSATLTNVDIFTIVDNSRVQNHWHANQLVLTKGALQISGLSDQTDPELPKGMPNQTLETSLGPEDLFERKETSENIGFWQMPKHIESLKAQGLPYKEWELKYVKLFTLPFTLVSMVLLAALFSLRMTRSGGVGGMILAGVSIALLLHFVTDILYSFALAGSLPVTISVWAVPVALMCISSFFLLEHEDG